VHQVRAAETKCNRCNEMNTLFEMPITLRPRDNITVLPVSVVEIGPTKTGVRGETDHDSSSSRSGFSPFPHEIAELCSQLFLRDCKSTIDPFAGWGERGDAMKRHGLDYLGFDLSADAIKSAMDIYGVNNILADSRTIHTPRHDALFTCPPYWGLESYNGEGIDKCRTWKQFLAEYESILSRFAEVAEAGATYCIVTGDWRQDGVYYDLTFQTDLILSQLGFTPFDKVIVSRLGISKVKIMLPQAKRLGYTVKVHETISVFKKLNPCALPKPNATAATSLTE